MQKPTYFIITRCIQRTTSLMQFLHECIPENRDRLVVSDPDYQCHISEGEDRYLEILQLIMLGSRLQLGGAGRGDSGRRLRTREDRQRNRRRTQANNRHQDGDTTLPLAPSPSAQVLFEESFKMSPPAHVLSHGSLNMLESHFRQCIWRSISMSL